jgi:hypothetical protein
MNADVILGLVEVRENVTPFENAFVVELLFEGVHTSCIKLFRLPQQVRHLLLVLLSLFGILVLRGNIRQPELGQYEVLLRGGQGLQVGVVGGGAVMV